MVIMKHLILFAVCLMLIQSAFATDEPRYRDLAFWRNLSPTAKAQIASGILHDRTPKSSLTLERLVLCIDDTLSRTPDNNLSSLNINLVASGCFALVEAK